MIRANFLSFQLKANAVAIVVNKYFYLFYGEHCK